MVMLSSSGTLVKCESILRLPTHALHFYSKISLRNDKDSLIVNLLSVKQLSMATKNVTILYKMFLLLTVYV